MKIFFFIRRLSVVNYYPTFYFLHVESIWDCHLECVIKSFAFSTLISDSFYLIIINHHTIDQQDDLYINIFLVR